MTEPNQSAPVTPLPPATRALPILAALALVIGVLALPAGQAPRAPSTTWLLASLGGLVGWRVAEMCLHRARDVRLQRLANQSISAHPELTNIPIRVALVPGSVAAFWTFTGWYRNYRFGALVYSKNDPYEVLPALADPSVRKLVESTLLSALLAHGWVREIDSWTIVSMTIDSPSGLPRMPARRRALLSRRSASNVAEAGRHSP